MKIVEKGWGRETWLHNDEKYCGKILFFNAGKKCSLHYHKLKSKDAVAGVERPRPANAA